MSLAYDRAVGIVQSIYDSRIKTAAVLPTVLYFSNARNFIDRWSDIRREAITIASGLQNVPRFHDIMPEQAAISANDGRDWRMLIMKAYGVDMPQNLRRCPTVASLLAQSPEVISCILSFARQAHSEASRPLSRHPAISSDVVDAAG